LNNTNIIAFLKPNLLKVYKRNNENSAQNIHAFPYILLLIFLTLIWTYTIIHYMN